MKFRKKPITVEAIQFVGPESVKAVEAFMAPRLVACGTEPHGPLYILIPTLEGPMKASVADWIIKGVKGEFYPCKPDIFEKTYERVVE